MSTIQEIISEFKDRVFSTTLNMVKDYQDAEDISQEVFLEVYQNLRKFRGDSSLSTWIYKLTVNKCLEHLRSRNALKRKSDTVSIKEQFLNIPGFDHPGVALEDKELAKTLMKAIDLLPESQRVAFTLHKMECLSHEEVGSIMDKTKSSVESLIHRAKQNLRTYLKTYYEG